MTKKQRCEPNLGEKDNSLHWLERGAGTKANDPGYGEEGTVALWYSSNRWYFLGRATPVTPDHAYALGWRYCCKATKPVGHDA